MMKEMLKKYFFRGFRLLNANSGIIFVVIFFSLVEFIVSLISTKNALLNVVFLLLSFFKRAYLLTIPLMIQGLLEKKILKPDFILRNTWKTARRLVIPSIVIFILISLAGMMAVGFLLSRGGNTNLTRSSILSFPQAIMSSTRNPLNHILFLPLTFFLELFAFHAVYFVIKQRSFFVSYLDSLRFSLRNLSFVLLLTIIYFAVGFISLLYPYPSDISGFISPSLITKTVWLLPKLLNELISVIMATAVTLYFLDKQSQR